MRLAPCLLALALVIGFAAPPAGAEWLILSGGKKIETEGAWALKGDLLTVHETSGRILTVAVSIVDAKACLKRNGGKLRIEVVPVELPGAVLKPGRQAPLELTPNPAVPGSAIVSQAISNHQAPAGASGSASSASAGSSAATSGPASRAIARSSSATAAMAATAAPAAPSGATAPAPPPAQNGSGTTEEVKARQLARQAQLQRDLRYHRIVEGCARMFIIDHAGFQRCVQAQWP